MPWLKCAVTNDEARVHVFVTLPPYMCGDEPFVLFAFRRFPFPFLFPSPCLLPLPCPFPIFPRRGGISTTSSSDCVYPHCACVASISARQHRCMIAPKSSLNPAPSTPWSRSRRTTCLKPWPSHRSETHRSPGTLSMPSRWSHVWSRMRVGCVCSLPAAAAAAASAGAASAGVVLLPSSPLPSIKSSSSRYQVPGRASATRTRRPRWSQWRFGRLGGKSCSSWEAEAEVEEVEEVVRGGRGGLSPSLCRVSSTAEWRAALLAARDRAAGRQGRSSDRGARMRRIMCVLTTESWSSECVQRVP